MRRHWRSAWNGDLRLAVEVARWGAQQPHADLVMSHATGFCKEVLHPVTDALATMRSAGRVVSFDHRNHGASARAPRPHGWWSLADDVLAVLDSVDRPVGVGHSCGGAALTYAELRRPRMFRSLVLIEPIIFPEGPDTDVEDELAKRALRRKPRFPSREEAYENFAEKPAFGAWDPAALRAYVDHGLVADGSEWALACERHDEADFYRQARHQTGWERLGEITCPVTIVFGEQSSSHSQTFVAELAARFTGTEVTVVSISGATHFVPMERPVEIAKLIVASDDRTN